MEREEPLPPGSDISPQAPPHPQRPRPRNIELFSTHNIEHPIPSPPYQRIPNTSSVLLDNYEEEEEQTPAYKSRSNLNLPDANMEKKSHHHHDDDYESKNKPTVHYPDDVVSPPLTSMRAPGITRFDTFDGSPSSRSSSLAGTDDDDDDDEDYDWSGEEDLVDEEAKFEQAMGVRKKATGWGLKRCVSSHVCLRMIVRDADSSAVGYSGCSFLPSLARQSSLESSSLPRY